MAYNQPQHKTFKDLLLYYINLYYLIREDNPEIKQNPIKHIKEIEKLEKDFHRRLSKRNPEWDNEENRGELRKQIDFLTGVFSDQEKAKQKTASVKALLEKLGKKIT